MLERTHIPTSLCIGIKSVTENRYCNMPSCVKDRGRVYYFWDHFCNPVAPKIRPETNSHTVEVVHQHGMCLLHNMQEPVGAHLHVSTAGYRWFTRSLWNVITTWKHARHEMCVVVYSHCCGHFTRQISRVLRFNPFCAKNGKHCEIKGIFSPENVYNHYATKVSHTFKEFLLYSRYKMMRNNFWVVLQYSVLATVAASRCLLFIILYIFLGHILLD